MAAQSANDFAELIHPTNRSTGAPLWSQVKASLTRLILEEALQEHAQLPTEAELCLRFGVSRTVVREALAQMVNERLIYKLQGKGAFVAGRRDDQDFVGTTVGFTGELADKRKEVSRRILRQEAAEAPARVCRLLGIAENTRMVFIDRVLSVEGFPRFIVRWAMIERVVPGLDGLPLENRSLYDTIGRQYGVKLARAERWIEAISAGAEEAELLSIPPGSPMLGIESVATNLAGEKIEYYTALYLTDRSRLHFSVAPPSF